MFPQTLHLPAACTTELRKRRIVITGGNGFLGTNLRLMLEQEGIPFLAPSREDMNLEETGAAKNILQKGDYVIHLAAAVGGIRKNTDSGEKLFTSNMRMGLNLFDACKEAAVGKVLVIGTACAYPDDAPLPLREEDIWNGLPNADTGPYGMAKRMLLYYGIAFHETLPFSIIHLIPTNLYGPHDHFDPVHGHVVPGMIARMYNAQQAGDATFPIWGDGTQTREFLHVSDACRGILLALWKEEDPHPINLGSNTETPVIAIAQMIKTALGYTGELVTDPSAPTGSRRRMLDTTKAKERLGFEATVPLQEGIEEMVKEFLTNVQARR
jgi:GDP-L-fucose synthase